MGGFIIEISEAIFVTIPLISGFEMNFNIAVIQEFIICNN